MSIISALFNLIKKIIKKVVGLVKNLFKKFWPLLLLIAIIVFAPYIAPFLTSIGMPMLGSFFGAIATSVTPVVMGALSWAWGGIASLGAAGWSAFSALSLGTQASVVLGAAALIAPEETAELVGEVVSTVGDAVSTVVGAIASAFPTWLWVGGAVIGAYWLLGGSDDEEDQRITA